MKIQKKKFIFNLSPTRVVGAISYFDKEKQKVVVDYISQKKIELEKDFSLINFRQETLKAIDSVCLDFISKNKISEGDYFIDTANIFLMAPWADYETYKINDEALSPFLLDDKYLDNLLSKTSRNDDKIILSSEIISSQANDYDVEIRDLINKKVQKLEVSFLDSFLLKFDNHFINGAIQNHFPILKINFNSFLPVLLNQIQKIYNPKDDFMFLDISAEITEFGIFKNGHITNMITIPFGKNKIIYKIIALKKITIFEAESFLKMYLKNELDDMETEIIGNIVDEEVQVLKNEIDKISDNLPFNTFIVSSKWETNKIIKDLDIFKNLYFIDKKVIENFVYFNDENDWDNFIALEAEFLED